jgi:putative oxidoreductase
MTAQTLTRDHSASEPSRALHYGLWTLQILLGLAFAFAGFTKAATPLVELATRMPWVSDVPGALVRFIGVSELAGGLGLILPAATRIKPQLTALAAAGLTLVMILAALFHAARGEYAGIAINGVLGGLAAFIAWGRSKRAPIEARG